MFYGPHRLERRTGVVTRDAYNRTVSSTEAWESIGVCRCDDSSTGERMDANGMAFFPKYHIVTDSSDIKAGDYVRALDGSTVRGQGEVKQVVQTNYLNYTSIYV